MDRLIMASAPGSQDSFLTDDDQDSVLTTQELLRADELNDTFLFDTELPASPPPPLFPEVEDDDAEDLYRDIMMGVDDNAGQQEERAVVEKKHVPSLPAATATQVGDKKRDEPKSAAKRKTAATKSKAKSDGKAKGSGTTTRRARRGKGTEFDTKDLLDVKPLRKMEARQPVPEEQKNEEYFLKRIQNTEASRKCRERKRALDMERVHLIQQLTQEVQQQAERIQAMENENQILKDLIKDSLGAGQALAAVQGNKPQESKKRKHDKSR